MRDTELYDEDTDTYYGLDYVDEDDDFDRYHCAHGTYIGTPGGPDILCFYCEMGYTREEFEEEMKWKRAQRTREALRSYVFGLIVNQYKIAQTFICIPGKLDEFGEWLKEIADAIKELTPSDLILYEDQVFGR